MRRHAKAIASAGFGVLAFALSLLGLPRIVVWLLVALGAFLLIASGLFWVGESRTRRRNNDEQPSTSEAQTRPENPPPRKATTASSASNPFGTVVEMVAKAFDAMKAQPGVVPSKETAPLTQAQMRAGDLLVEADDLEKRMWRAVKETKRSSIPLPILPTPLVKEIGEWNRRVLDLADQVLSVKEAAQVEVLPKIVGNMVSADQVEAMLNSNRATLRRIMSVEKMRAKRL